MIDQPGKFWRTIEAGKPLGKIVGIFVRGQFGHDGKDRSARIRQFGRNGNSVRHNEKQGANLWKKE